MLGWGIEKIISSILKTIVDGKLPTWKKNKHVCVCVCVSSSETHTQGLDDIDIPD